MEKQYTVKVSIDVQVDAGSEAEAIAFAVNGMDEIMHEAEDWPDGWMGFTLGKEASVVPDAVADALPEGWKRIGSLRKFERFVVAEGDAIEYRVERHTDDAVWASWMQGGVWGKELKGFACGFPVRVLGGTL